MADAGKSKPELILVADDIPANVRLLESRLQALMERQREIQRANYAKHVGQRLEVMVEGVNTQRGQVVGRSSQNKTVNFTTSALIQPATGSYVRVQVTRCNPNSLAGEMVQ